MSITMLERSQSTAETTGLLSELSSRGRRAERDVAFRPTPNLARRVLDFSNRPTGISESGPVTLPLFYTALRKAPTSLCWETKPSACAHRLTLGSLESKHNVRPLLITWLEPGIGRFDLKDISFESGVSYVWFLEEADATSSPRRSEEARSVVQGRFWLLTELEREELHQGKELLSRASDPDFAAMGLAVLLAERRLFQDALQLATQKGANQSAGRSKLTAILRAILYAEMGKALDAVMGTDGETPPVYRAWAKYREQSYRRRANNQSASQPVSPIEAVRTGSSEAHGIWRAA